ncbi:hypothetical protein SteCoe_25966 [Stentor coeruleus]|uniref:Kelch motif family protein n=1 Tax=Stentor coeruleus TaxID=5963 RepID=A0A1R2BE12_9CILI|nr:hypothetical protein SteCoe_25966 [Stentor coeruleus]
MGTCCGSNRQGKSQSIFCIDTDGKSIIEYNIHKDNFDIHSLKVQVPAMAKYCEIMPNKILIAGGFKRLKNRFGEPVNDVYLFDKEHGLCNKSSLDQPRTGHCLIAVAGVAYMISGVISHILPTKECQRYNIISDAWETISPLSKPRILAAGCFFGQSIYITGGNPGNTLQNYRDIEVYSIFSNTWKILDIKLPMDIWRHACLPHKNGIIIFGGNGNRSHNLDCFKIDLVNNIIVQLTWLSQGGEFQGCNFGEGENVYAFETVSARTVSIFSQGKWTSKVRNIKQELIEQITL